MCGVGQQGLTTEMWALEGPPWYKTLLEFAINPTTEPVDRRAGSPQARQLPRRE